MRRRLWPAAANSALILSPWWPRRWFLPSLPSFLACPIIGSMADQYIGTRWTAIVIFAVLVLVLVFRPRGLLGDRSAVQGGGE